MTDDPCRAEDDEVLQRSSLLRSVTHDLRTPLAAIRAIATDLHDAPGYDEATRQELLLTVCDEVDRLDRLVGNLLSMSSIDAGAFAPARQAIDVGELVRHRLQALSSLLREHDLQVDIPSELPLAHADYGQLDQVLTNLLGNAERHAPAGTAIAVAAEVAAPDWIAVSVVDHGPGIEPVLRESVFDAFQRGPGSRSTGLGLAICRSIIDAHGGEISVAETPGGGTTVRFTVPEHPSTAATPPPAPDEAVR